MKLPNIAIDGPAASGKTAVARLLAQRLHLVFLDTGAMYRAVTWCALESGCALQNQEAVVAIAKKCPLQVISDSSALGYKILVGQLDITAKLHEPSIDRAVGIVAAISGVRRELVRRQQAMAEAGGIIMVGRDITTVVMPQAECKFFLDADVVERAKRRFLELSGQGVVISREEVLQQMQERDRQDTTRSDSPLYLAEGVTRFDSTGLSLEQVVEQLSAKCARFMPPGSVI